MSECFKSSKDLPVIVQLEEYDCDSVHELKEMLLQMTVFHGDKRAHIGTVKDKLRRTLCRLLSS